MISILSKFRRKHLLILVYRNFKYNFFGLFVSGFISGCIWIVALHYHEDISFTIFSVIFSVIFIYLFISLRDKYNSTKIKLFRQIAKKDIIIQKIISKLQELVAIEGSYHSSMERKLFIYTTYNRIKSCAIGQLFYQEIKRYPLFSDKYCIAFGLLNLRMKPSGNKASQFQLDRLKKSLLENND